MKKEFKSAEIEIVRIQAASIIATSGQGDLCLSNYIPCDPTDEPEE